MSTVYIVDTSYFMELYAVPGFSDPVAISAVRSKFRAAVDAGHILVLPVGVIYESGNHVADVKTPAQRINLANKLFDAIQRSATHRQPFLLAPAEDTPMLLEYLKIFKDQSVHRAGRGKGSLGLVDTQIAAIARHWKGKPGYTVHIWTRDTRLKREEPDTEPNPFT